MPPHYRAILEGRMESHGLCGRRLPDAYWQEIRARTHGLISMVDDQIGRVVAHLSELGKRENTAVGFISDHGDMMGDHWMIYKGSYLYESCVRIPWILTLQGGAAGVVHDGLVSQIDLAPTILDICGLPSPNRARLKLPAARERTAQVGEVEPWPGRSLASILRGDNSALRSSVVIHNDDHFLGLRTRSIVTDETKLRHYPGHEFGELFDLQRDPGELHNLWDRSEWRQIKMDLIVRLYEEDALSQPWLPMPYSVA